MFKQRITNYSYLRLSKIILHDPTNCIHRLKIFVKKISIMQAWRALMFIQKLFGDTHKLYTNHQKIFLTIKISNRKIVRAVLNHCIEGMLKSSTTLELKIQIFKLILYIFILSRYTKEN